MLPLTLVLQAGGQSTRMGRDKALAPFRGQPLVEYILAQTRGLAADTVVITNHPDDYRFLGLPLFGDVVPDKGALGGLYTALHYSTHPHCLVLACDMPFVNRPLLEHFISLAPDYDAVVPRLNSHLPMGEGAGGRGPGVGSQAEPFRAVYSKTCLPPIKAALDSSQMRVISFFDQVNIRFVEQEEIERFDPGALTFFNINTPADLAEAEKLAEAFLSTKNTKSHEGET